jgi:hypothetical protein
VARARAGESQAWLRRQQRRLSGRYDCYWYRTEKGTWTKKEGFPVTAEEWSRLQALVVRRRFSPRAASARGFPRDAMRVFRDLFPLYRFTCVADSGSSRPRQ